MTEAQTSANDREVLRTVAHDLANSAFVLKLALESLQEFPPDQEIQEMVKSALGEELQTLRRSVDSIRNICHPPQSNS